MYANLAAAQEEWPRNDLATLDDRVPDSPLTNSLAQQIPPSSQVAVQPDQPKKSGCRGSWVVAPLPISSPALGTGVIPVLGYIFPFRKGDEVSPPSVVGAAGLVTNNRTRGFAAYADLFIREDTYRITSLYVRGNFNYDLYGVGIAAGQAGEYQKANGSCGVPHEPVFDTQPNPTLKKGLGRQYQKLLLHRRWIIFQ
jgi:hypothetical protein